MSAYSAESFDLVVVGAGMVGSAAARHAAEAGRKVALVGPGEPTQEAARVYGCHADEGRICRRLDVDPVWAVLFAGAEAFLLRASRGAWPGRPVVASATYGLAPPRTPRRRFGDVRARFVEGGSRTIRRLAAAA